MFVLCVYIIFMNSFFLICTNYLYAQDEILIEVASKEQMYDGIVVTGPKVLWKSVINGQLSLGVSTSMLPHDNSLYVFLRGNPSNEKNGYVCSLRNKNGTIRWVRTIGGVFEEPVLSDDTLYLGSYDGNFYSIATATGEVHWKKETESWCSSGMRVPPIEDDKNIFFGYDDGNLYSVDKKTGEENWRFNVNGTLYATPLLERDMLYFATSDGKVYAVDKDSGIKKWDTTISPDIFFLNLLYEGENIALLWCEYKPGEGKERGATHITAFDTKTGQRQWDIRWDTNETISWPITGFMKLFVTVGAELRALDFRTGESVWSYKSGTVLYPALEINGDTLFASDTESSGEGASAPHNIYAFHCETGKKLWEYKTSAGIGHPFIITDNLLCSSSRVKDNVDVERSYVFFVDVRTGEEKGRVMIKEGEAVVSQIVSEGNTFYVTTKGQNGDSYIYKLLFEE